MTKVGNLMKQDFPMVKPSDSITAVARKMKKYQAETAVVCSDSKQLIGIITQETIIATIVANNRDSKRESAISVMTNHTPKVSLAADVTEAAKTMATHSTNVTLVVEHGKILGIITLDDLIRESPALGIMVMAKRIEKFAAANAKKKETSSTGI